jgi:transcriptional regulator with XRE-family HTH domain
MKRIGERIRRKRDALSMQLNELAQKVGVSASALSQIEKAKAFPSIFTLKAIAENLNTTVGELIGENESLSKNPVVRKTEMKFVEITSGGTEVFLLSHHDVLSLSESGAPHKAQKLALSSVSTPQFLQ